MLGDKTQFPKPFQWFSKQEASNPPPQIQDLPSFKNNAGLPKQNGQQKTGPFRVRPVFKFFLGLTLLFYGWGICALALLHEALAQVFIDRLCIRGIDFRGLFDRLVVAEGAFVGF